MKFRNVFANHIKFQVHRISFLDLVEVGVFVGVGNDGHRKLILTRVNNGQADAIDTNGTFLYGDVVLILVILEVKKPASFSIINFGTKNYKKKISGLT